MTSTDSTTKVSAPAEAAGVLSGLVAHQCSLGASCAIEAAQRTLHRLGVDCAAVLEAGRVVGLLMRSEVDRVLGSRSGIGFAVYAKRPVSELWKKEFLCVDTDQAVTSVLAAVQARTGSAFYDDVVLGVAGVSVVALVATFFFMSIMFPTLFAMGVKNLGPHTKRGSSFMIMAIVGGALLPYVMGLVADHSSTAVAYLLPMGCFVIVAAYARAALKKI